MMKDWEAYRSPLRARKREGPDSGEQKSAASQAKSSGLSRIRTWDQSVMSPIRLLLTCARGVRHEIN